MMADHLHVLKVDFSIDQDLAEKMVWESCLLLREQKPFVEFDWVDGHHYHLVDLRAKASIGSVTGFVFRLSRKEMDPRAEQVRERTVNFILPQDKSLQRDFEEKLQNEK